MVVNSTLSAHTVKVIRKSDMWMVRSAEGRFGSKRAPSLQVAVLVREWAT
jgi:hypothetical protein